MREKPEVIVKYICMGLGALLFIQFVRIILGANPLAHVVVPELPSLADDSASTNQATIASSNVTPPVHKSPVQNSTNSAASTTNIVTAGTNSTVSKTNIATARTNGSISTNIAARAGARMNVNAALLSGTNTIAVHSGHRHRRGNPFGGMGGMGFMPGQQKTTVSPAIQASIDQITDSEILGPVIHPLPMALMGIAGDEAFLRSPDGQTGLVKEGDELGSIKLIKIGTNRVLIEENGQQQELTIFDGMGGQTLLNKSLQSTNENNNP
ncbi:MAG TPA: hypothetical protein VMF08_18785 [Candidatus Sulfotelmatobacter sp.]|nr:hypothetical protein [Candidatus Sulfotelmatobacter sp.]